MQIKIKKLISPLLLLLFVLFNFVVQAQTKVSGKVTSALGAPVVGATVTVKGTSIATSTSETGNFEINVPAGNNRILVITSVGFQPLEVAATAVNGNLVLAEANSNLNEVVVTGYSSQRKKDITGAVTVVKVADLNSIPASSVENQLQGRAAGVNVVSNSQPGSVSKVRIRGYASFTGNDPLYIVDGVPLSSMLGINPDDIESMQVLKDAASASIYGARASNGVIIVTTKKGKSGKAKVSYSGYYGIQDPGKGYEGMMTNPQDFADLTWLALKNSNQPQSTVQYGSGPTPVLPDYLLAGSLSGVQEGNPAANPDLYDLSYANLADANYSPYLIVKANKQGTNWWEQVTRNAPIIDQNINVSGGSPDRNRYLFGLNYFSQDGIVITNFYKRYTARLNTEFNVGRNIRIGENIQLLWADRNGANNNNEQSELGLARGILPIIPVYTINPGDFAGTKGNGIGTADNPVAIRERQKNNRNQDFGVFGNVYAEVDFLKNFTIRTSFGGNYSTYNSRSYPSIEYEGAENNRNPTYASTFGRGRSWTWTNQISYKQVFGDHNIQALIGTEAVEEVGESITGSRSNYFVYNNYDYITLSSGTSNQLASGGLTTENALFSYFGKVDYSFRDRYLASVTLRRDASSRFGSEKREATYPAASLGWRISEESFLRDVKWINELKIRGSYGSMGNQRIPNTNQFTLFSPSNGSANYDLAGTSTSTQAAFYLSFIGNNRGQWESNITTNVGFDANLFNGNTDITFDWYKKSTKDLLYPVEQIGTAGGTASGNPPFFNVGSMENTGIDIGINQRAWLGGKQGVRFEAGITFTTYKNKITKIADGVPFFDYNSPLNEQNRIGGVFTRNAVGQPINAFYGYKVIGLFASADDVAKSPIQSAAAPGRLKFQDTDGNGTIDADDRVFYGNPNPKFTYGINLAFVYKGFDLTAFFYGVQGRDVINYSKFGTDFYSSGVGNKVKDALYNSWSPTNLNAKIPIQENTSTFSTGSNPSSYYMEDGSYLRMRNLTLGYTLPQDLVRRVRIDKVRIYIQAVNLFTITNYSGLDPEIISTDDRAAFIDASTYPAVKQFIFGANINF